MKLLKTHNDIQRGSTAVALRAGFWYVASTVLLKGITFITTPIFARLMSDTAYGEFSNYASWQVTLLIITGAEMYNTLGRAYYDFKDEYDKYVSSVTFITIGITIAAYFFFLFSGSWIYNIVSIPKQFVHILFLTLMFQACKSIFLTRERTLYRYKTVAALTVANLLIPTLIAVLLVIFASEPQKLAARIYGYYLPASVIGLGCAVVLLYRGRTFKKEHCKYAFILALPMLAHYLSAYMLTSTNIVVTKNIFGAQITALVSIAASTIHILTVVFQSLSGALTTWVMDNLEQGKRIRIRRNVLVYIGILAVVSVGVILLSPEVVWILGGEKYRESAFLVPGFVLGAFIQGITSVFMIILTYDKNIVKTAVFTGVISVTNIAAKIVLLPILGYRVLPYISVMTYAVLFIINYLLIRRAGYSDTVHLKGISLIIIIVSAVTALYPLLFEHSMVRYIVLLAFVVISAIILWKKRDMLISILRQKKKSKEN